MGIAAGATSGSGVGSLGQNGCALGWYKCSGGGDTGKGCCPSGYTCGDGASCTATDVVLNGGATGTVEVAKNNGAGGSGSEMLGTRGFLVFCMIAFVGIFL